MPAASDRYVSLPSGLALPLEPVLLALDLEARGFDLRRDGNDIVIRPISRLTDTDKAALRRWKGQILKLIDHLEGVQ